MKTEESDKRYRELQQDLIHALSTDQLQDLEQEIPSAAKQVMQRMRRIFLILVGGSVGLAFLGTQFQESKVVIWVLWFLICFAVSAYLIIEDLNGFRWALRFINSKGQEFCLPLWLNSEDDSRLLRSWREQVGQPCEVKAIVLRLGESMGFRHGIKNVLSVVTGGVAVWLVMGFSGTGVQVGLFLLVLIGLFVSRFYTFWIEARFEPDLFGEGYKEVVSTLDARGLQHGTRRQRH
jgi:hypothetical protein